MQPTPSTQRPRIAVLSERVRNQIAAGEVIERPASVVKELVENAIDAGARSIRIDLEEGGAKLIRVVDDGSGMSREDLTLAFVAHATSKLFEVEDLDHIGSLGFRGEALASMGAIARCSILSRERDAATGWKIECEGSAIAEPREAGSPVGTTVEVRELFHNVPARRRFMKTTATELGRAIDVVQRIAVATEGVGFTLTHDGRRVFDVEATMDVLARVRRTFGVDLADALVAVNGRDGDVSLTGFVAPPRFARGDTARQMWFLNGRIVRDKVLVRALKDAYKGFLFDSRQPVAFLSLSMDPAKVDVNVHPAKSDVRFRDERRLFGFVVNTIREGVRKCDMATPGARLVERVIEREERALPFGEVSSQRGSIADLPTDFAARSPSEPAHAPWGEAPSSHSLSNRHVSSRESSVREPLRVYDLPARAGSSPGTSHPVHDDVVHGPFLQVAKTYIVRPLGDGFEIVDQHALHERIQFESIVAEMRRGHVEMQRLLVPELVELSRAEVAALSDHFDALAKIGIELAAFGATTIAVHGLPARLARPRPTWIVRDALEAIEASRALEPERLLEDVLHRAACRSSVMAGDTLSDEEMRSLLERGRHLVSDQTCVHGRPTRVRFVGADLERAFERR